MHNSKPLLSDPTTTPELLNELARLRVELADSHAREATLQAREAQLNAELQVARESQQILDALMEYIPEGITIADAPDVTIRQVSRFGRELTGRPAEQIEHIPMEDHPEQWQIYSPVDGTLVPGELLPLSRATLHGEIVENEELILRRGDGSEIFILCNAGPIRDQQGTITGGLIAWRDITERRQAQEELNSYARRLEAANRDLRDFAIIASHDLQEPLRKVKSFGDMLLQNYQTGLDETGRQYLRRMVSAADRMQQMITSLMTFSRVSTQGQPFRPVDLNVVLHDVLSDLEILLARTSGQVEAPALPVIHADVVQMRQLFQNLIGNGLKFHRKGEQPLVQLGVRWLDNRAIELTFTDNGIGFDEAFHEEVFLPFRRLHGRTEYEGTGMGLAICQKIVLRHGGEITARSQPGQGTTFLVRLPVVH